jgi:hypothetical protein
MKLPARHRDESRSEALPGTARVLPVWCRGGLSATVSPAPGRRPPEPRRATPGIRLMIMIMPVTGPGPGAGPRIASSSFKFQVLKT